MLQLEDRQLKVIGFGDGGLKDVRSMLYKDRIQCGGFAVTAVFDETGKMNQVKYVSFIWIGSDVKPVKRAGAVTLIPEARKYFKVRSLSNVLTICRFRRRR